MISVEELNEQHLDFLRELENIGTSHAVTALSAMLGETIDLSVSRASFCGLSDISRIFRGPEAVVAAVIVELQGDINGHLLMLQDAENAQQLAETAIRAALNDEVAAQFQTQLQNSAALEVANILCGAYISAVCDLTGFDIQSTPPIMAVDMCGAVMNLLACRYGEISDVVLLLDAEFSDVLHHISGRIFLFSDSESYGRLLGRMGLI